MTQAAESGERQDIFVAAIDLDGDLSPVVGAGGAAAARLLLRRKGRPIDWVTIPHPEIVISTAQVEKAIFEQRSNVWNVLLDESISREGMVLPTPFSIIVCTRDREAELDGCLRALSSLDYPAVEIIVVDNASRTAATREIAERWKVRYVREDLPGLDNARNRGVMESSLDLIAFTDDDVRVDPRWLGRVARLFDNPAVGAVTGLIAPASLDTEARRLFELVYHGMGKGTSPVVWSRDRLPDAYIVRSHHVGAGANMIFRRAALYDASGFDPALDVGTPSHGAGDLDMFHRLLVRGWMIHYEPAALVWHRHRAELNELERQLCDNGRAYGVHLLRRLRDGDISRLTTLRVAVGWLLWLTGRLVRRVLKREKMPLRFLVGELRGALSAPWAYYLTYRDAGIAPRPGSSRNPG